MAKFTPRDDIDEIRKRGDKSDHRIKRITNSSVREKLDSDAEDKILTKWVNKLAGDDFNVFTAGSQRYPAITQLDENFVVIKEVELDGYRIDAVVRSPDGTLGLVEVKQKSELTPSVVGHLLVKQAKFENLFTVNPTNIELILLADSVPSDYRSMMGETNQTHNLEIQIDSLSESSSNEHNSRKRTRGR
ncbi:hypothetical protein HTG_17645 [Natrinema mahii]|nr:hypothetical protein HTG_17645 [Natrinema mahii]